MDIHKIICVLDRDDSLQLDNDEKTYQQEDEINDVDWDRLWELPSKETNEPWVLSDPDVIGTILGGGNGSAVPWPKDVQEKDKGIWDVCAWYQPIHFFAFDWGIFIREDCLIRQASRIAAFSPTSQQLGLSPAKHATMLLKASFAAFYFHEHFHHKVESFGVRLHVVTGRSKYRPYKKNVYRTSLGSDNCLEEALANADSFHRFFSSPYNKAIDKRILKAARDYLIKTFPFDPPGYRMASNYLTSSAFGSGASILQSQILEATLTPNMDPNDWVASPHMLRSLYNYKSNIYTVVNQGQKSVLPTKIFPRVCSTRELIKIFENKGYVVVSGGKGSHVKLKNQKGEVMILPGNRREISKGLLSSVLKTVGLSIFDLSSV